VQKQGKVVKYTRKLVKKEKGGNRRRKFPDEKEGGEGPGGTLRDRKETDRLKNEVNRSGLTQGRSIIEGGWKKKKG